MTNYGFFGTSTDCYVLIIVDPFVIMKCRTSLRLVIIYRKDNDKLEKVRAHKESMKCVTISESNPPTACFYTLLNAANK